MRPERMDRILLACRRDDAPATTRTLAHLSAVHITQASRETVLQTLVENGEPNKDAAQLSHLLTATRSLLAKLPKSNQQVESRQQRASAHASQRVSRQNDAKNHETQAAQENSWDEQLTHVQDIIERHTAREHRLSSIEHDIANVTARIELLGRLQGLDAPVESLFSTRAFQHIVMRSETPLANALLNSTAITPLTDPRIVVLTVRSSELQALRERIASSSTSATIIDISLLRDVTGTPEEAIRQLSAQQGAAKKELFEERKRTVDDDIRILEQIEPRLALALLIAQAPQRFGQTKQLTIIEGFIPRRRTHEIIAALPQALIDTEPATHAPILLRNVPPARGFEALLRMYSLPRYDEMDPTSLMAITFPIFFGFMLADIGYGAVAFAAFFTMRFAVPALRELCNILLLSSISTIVFGVLTAEVFGVTMFHATLHRAQDLPLLFGIVVLIGLAHINLGLLLGMMNDRYDGWFFSMVKHGSWMLLQAAVIMLIASTGMLSSLPFFKHIIPDMFAAWSFLILSIAGIVYSEGAMHLIEVPTIIINILSYMRLAAIGLSSVYLAIVVNDLARPMLTQGGVWTALGVAILLIGHTGNLLLGLLGPFLHSLRLHYVEFFTKFYKGGGEPYHAFGELEVAP